MCLRCGVPTEPGYIPDRRHGGRSIQMWIRGEPVRSWLTGLETKQGLSVAAYRCPKCCGVELVASR